MGLESDKDFNVSRDLFMLKTLLKKRRHPANVFIMMVAIVIFGFLMGLSYSIGQLKMINLEQASSQTVKTKLKLISNSGLNEVIATRLFPTSNRYSWQFNNVTDINATADPVMKPLPFLRDSSYVYETASRVNKRMGRYQYVILGTNPYYNYNASTGAYTASTVKMDSGEHLYNISNPVYVAVRSFLCFNDSTDSIAYDAVQGDNSPPYAKCGAGQSLKEKSTLTQLEVTGTTDLNTQINIVSSQQITPDTTFTLPSYILNRNNMSTNQFNFENWWTNTGIHHNPNGNAVPVGIRYTRTKFVITDLGPPVVWEPVGPEVIYKPWPGGSVVTLPNNTAMPSDVAIIPSVELLFRSAIDERSLYVSTAPFNTYTPVPAIYMGVESNEHPGYNQELFSGTVLRKSGLLGEGYVSQTIGFPSMSLLKITGDVPCNSVTNTYNSNQILFNSKGQLRDADGFKNTTVYTINYTAPTC
jgi:hypothetical protein